MTDTMTQSRLPPRLQPDQVRIRLTIVHGRTRKHGGTEVYLATPVTDDDLEKAVQAVVKDALRQYRTKAAA